MARRLPVYLLIDTSGSMKGEPIESVKVGIESMLSTLRNDPYALETVNISIITYDREVKQLIPLTPIDELQMPEITTPESGPTNMGEALEVLLNIMEKEINKGTQDKIKVSKFATVVCCAAGPRAKTEELCQLTDKVYQIDTLDGTSLSKFFKWVSGIIGEGNKSMGATSELLLPPPPEEVNVVI